MLFAQESHPGQPQLNSREISEGSLPVIEMQPPDVAALRIQDQQQRAANLPMRMGVNLPIEFKWNEGTVLSKTPGFITRVFKIRTRGAVGLGLYFSHFHLPVDARLFVYDPQQQQVAGAFTADNNADNDRFAIEVIRGDQIFIEYTCRAEDADRSAFTVNEILFVYTPMVFTGNNSALPRANSDCEVNTACSEGDNWRNQIKSVVRILIKNGSSSYWCSGTVMNSTAVDFSPLILTADHCAMGWGGEYASASDLSQWIFYFGYETPSCSNAVVEDSKSVTGAVKLASSSPSSTDGSDFYLVRLKNAIPPSYEPFYAGWSNTGQISNSGVGIHHPAGEVKKISTYTQPLGIDQWGANAGTHYTVVWSATENGHGVTEGGSSGSPIFDNQGRVIGQLTGGDSGCSNLAGADFYGRLSYSWVSNGNADSVQLKPWLDPGNIGLTSINGAYNENRAVARFVADTVVIAVGSIVTFTDNSLGSPQTWSWEFEAGSPSSSGQQVPPPVKYLWTGNFNVKLTVSNQYGADSLVRENYIRVVPRLFPNPSNGHITMMAGNNDSAELQLIITNTLGKQVYTATGLCKGERFCTLDLSGLAGGIYLFTIIGNGDVNTTRMVLLGN